MSNLIKIIYYYFFFFKLLIRTTKVKIREIAWNKKLRIRRKRINDGQLIKGCLILCRGI